jgi:thiol-disulfide isomerase/thioredoxin
MRRLQLTRRFFALGLGLTLGLATLIAAKVPRRAPEYVVNLPTGKQLLLSQYRGKVVSLMFILTTCPHCQHTSQLIERLNKEYAPRGFQPILVAFNEQADKLVADLARRLGLSYPAGYDSRLPVYSFLERPLNQRTFVPLLVFVDRNGTIRAQYTGDDKFFAAADQEKNLRSMIERLLNEPSTASKGRSRKKPS